jgi:ABC-type transport system involved in multi-copper enzyme maturation permease subunit
MATIQTQDVMPVGSRVSWSAILAGAVTALATYLLLSVLGAALGLSVVRGTDVSNESLGIGAAVWAVLTMVLSLFLGGWVTSQCTVGENKTEAAFYGLVMWGVVLAVLLWLAVGSIHMGFNALIGIASTAPAEAVTARLTDEQLRGWGWTEEQITANRAQFDKMRDALRGTPAEIRTAAEDPRTVKAAWWTFGGLVLSLLAAIGGSLLGAGPNLMLAGFARRSTLITTGVSEREREIAGR